MFKSKIPTDLSVYIVYNSDEKKKDGKIQDNSEDNSENNNDIHSEIISSKSDYFCTLLSISMNESKTRTLTLEDI